MRAAPHCAALAAAALLPSGTAGQILEVEWCQSQANNACPCESSLCSDDGTTYQECPVCPTWDEGTLGEMCTPSICSLKDSASYNGVVRTDEWPNDQTPWPCDNQNGLCKTCHANGCDECKKCDNGQDGCYWKYAYNYACLPCSTYFDYCDTCQDHHGCGVCETSRQNDRKKCSWNGIEVWVCTDTCAEQLDKWDDICAANDCATTAAPTPGPTPAPTPAPTPLPPGETAPPTEGPVTGAPTTAEPTEAPVTGAPTEAPTTDAPTTQAPTSAPSGSPTTKTPTATPTAAPTTKQPTAPPSNSPTTKSPTEPPTAPPTAAPTVSPTASPTVTQYSCSDGKQYPRVCPEGSEWEEEGDCDPVCHVYRNQLSEDAEELCRKKTTEQSYNGEQGRFWKCMPPNSGDQKCPSDHVYCGTIDFTPQPPPTPAPPPTMGGSCGCTSYDDGAAATDNILCVKEGESCVPPLDGEEGGTYCDNYWEGGWSQCNVDTVWQVHLENAPDLAEDELEEDFAELSDVEQGQVVVMLICPDDVCEEWGECPTHCQQEQAEECLTLDEGDCIQPENEWEWSDARRRARRLQSTEGDVWIVADYKDLDAAERAAAGQRLSSALSRAESGDFAADDPDAAALSRLRDAGVSEWRESPRAQLREAPPGPPPEGESGSDGAVIGAAVGGAALCAAAAAVAFVVTRRRRGRPSFQQSAAAQQEELDEESAKRFSLSKDASASASAVAYTGSPGSPVVDLGASAGRAGKSLLGSSAKADKNPAAPSEKVEKSGLMHSI